MELEVGEIYQVKFFSKIKKRGCSKIGGNLNISESTMERERDQCWVTGK